MNSFLGFMAGAVVLAGGSMAQAQHFHGHAHYHRGHIHLHGHYHYPSYSQPSYYTTAPAVSPTVIVVQASAATLKPNALPSYTGSGVTLRLPAEFPDPVFVRIDKRDIELKPGTEITLKDKSSYFVDFDRGGDFGPARNELLSEGKYKMAVGHKGWLVLPDAPVPAELRRNKLPGEPKK
jgi:hypothetical protein